jgi:hypothetical protein
MDGNAEIETERDVLKRIVALLFSFAGLAERVSRRSYPVRCLVLWVLRRAEMIARDWIAEGGSDEMQLNPPIAVLHRNSQAETMQLAQSFRVLARMLRRELRLEERFARRLMRGKRNRAAAATPRRCLHKPAPLCRLARTLRFAMLCLPSPGFEAAPRVDTS